MATKSEGSIFTKCAGCVFAKMEDLKQTGCTLNRSKKLNPQGVLEKDEEDSKEYYTLDRFCIAYRPEDWANVLTEEEREDLEKTAREEIRPRIGFFVFHDTEDVNFKKLTNTLQSIKDQPVSPSYVVVNNTQVEYNEGIQEILATMFDFNETQHHLLLDLFDRSSELLIDEAFRHAKNGYIYTTISGATVDPLLSEKLDKRLNVDLRRVALVKPHDGCWNGMLFQASLFKALRGNLSYVAEDTLERDSRNFIQRVEDMPCEDPDLVSTWEEFNRD